jgi:hypothetical protein
MAVKSNLAADSTHDPVRLHPAGRIPSPSSGYRHNGPLHIGIAFSQNRLGSTSCAEAHLNVTISVKMGRTPK